ncbi:hypothetical protein DFAR_490020 [Desulfarculales bacterium]
MGAAPGYARNLGRPLRPRRHHRHRPNARGPTARNHQRNSTLADAVLDHLIHNAYKINLKKKSMRKKLASLTDDKAPMAHNANTSGAVPRPPGPHHRIRWPFSNGTHGPFPWNQHIWLRGAIAPNPMRTRTVGRARAA